MKAGDCLPTRRVPTSSSIDTSVSSLLWLISSGNFPKVFCYPSTREFWSTLTAISVVLDDNLSYKGNLYNHDSGPLEFVVKVCFNDDMSSFNTYV